MSSSSTALSPPAFDWHPKLTPYRLAFIIIISGLGITKAILVSYGHVASSITIEWITGVVVALSFQFLNEYEYKLHHSVNIDWIFSYDCLNIIKALLARTGENRIVSTQSDHPVYTDSTSSLPPIVTAYRLWVSTTVSVCGIAKMLCGYFGLSTEMNTLDWIVAIPLTLGLYYIGLYEEKESNIPRVLFDVEYSAKVRLSLERGLYYIGGLTLCSVWFGLWLEMLRGAVADFNRTETETSSVWEVQARHMLQWVGITSMFAMLEIGVLGIGVVLWPILEAWSGKYAISIRKHTVHLAILSLYLLSAAFSIAFSLAWFFFTVLTFVSFSGPLFIRAMISGVMLCLTALPAGLSLAVVIVVVDVYSNPL